MEPEVYKLLEKIAKDAGYDFERAQKRSFGNPLDNSMFRSMVDTGLKALEGVAIATLDWKLTAIVKLLQSWIKDRELEQQEPEEDASFSYDYNINPY